MRRPPWLVAAALLAVSPPLATHHGKTSRVIINIDIAPGSGNYPADQPLSVTITFCSTDEPFASSPTIDYTAALSQEFSYTGGSQFGCADYGTSTGAVTMPLGDNVLTATISSANDWAQASAYYTGVSQSPPMPSVTPDNYPGSVHSPNTNGHLTAFSVTNTGGQAGSFSVSCNRSGSVSWCGNVSPAGPLWLNPNASAAVNVSYNVGAEGNGTVGLTATGSHGSDPGSMSVPVVGHQVAVTPDGGTAAYRAANSAGHQETFTIQNTGTLSGTFNLSCTRTASVNSPCTPSQSSVTLAPNASTNVTASYSVGTIGTGTITLTATGDGAGGNTATNSGSYNVPVILFGVAVTPDGTTGVPRVSPQYGGGPYEGPERFWVKNTGTGTQTFDFSAVNAYGGVDVPQLSLNTPSPVTLSAGDSAHVGVDVGATVEPGLRGIILTAFNAYASDQGMVNVPVDTLLRQGNGTIEAVIFPLSGAVAVTTMPIIVDLCTRTGIDYPMKWTIKLNGVALVAYNNAGVDTVGLLTVDNTVTHIDCWQTTGGDPFPTRYVGTVALQPGENSLSVVGLSSDSPFPYGGGASADWQAPMQPMGVTVTREGQYVQVPPSTLDTIPFRVRNTGTLADSIDVIAWCSGAATGASCTSHVAAIGLEPNTEAVVAVTYTSTATVGDSGIVTLRASGRIDPSAVDTAATEITVVPAATAGVAVLSTGATLERDLCVTVALGADAAAECGDLRLAHPLPVTRTLNRAWSPTLIYNSQHASPRPLVQADVTLPSGTTDSIEAILKVGGTERGRGRWPGWPAGQTRRIAVADATGPLASGLGAYSLEVRRKPAGGSWTAFATPAVTVPIVKRDASPFGAGWWLAGLERLDSLGATNKVWTGGDGSMRRYVEVPPSGSNKWAAANVDHPDTLKLEGGVYVRYLPNNLRVRFDGTGKHVETVNRLNQITSFQYDACGRLYRVTPPPDPTRFYEFTYQSGVCTTLLASVIAPPNGSTARVVTVTSSGGRVTAFNDPDTSTVAFGYEPGTNRVTSRTNRLNKVTTYSYDAAKRISGYQLPIWTSPVAIKSAESRGDSAFGAAPPLDSAFASIDGPRTDVLDISKFWVNAFGAPVRTRNPVGNETVVTYDATWPGLPKRVRGPNRFTTDAFYNNRALTDSTKAWNPLGDGRNAVSKYFWNPVWFMPDTVITPSGVRTKFDYDASGNRIWQQLGPNSARRVNYSFNAQGQVTSVLAPLSSPDSVFYDATLGNLRKTKSPLGHLTLVYTDAIGRDTLSASNPRDTIPSDSANIRNNGVRVRTVYDIIDQVKRSVTWSGQITANGTRILPPDTIRLEHLYDKEGNVLSTTRNYSAPNTTGLYALTSGWTYDDANRRVTATSPSGGTTTDSLDLAGNPITVTTPRGHKIRTEFDAANRATRRITPQVTYPSTVAFNAGSNAIFPTRGGAGFCARADTTVFAFDDAGQMITANNWAARIARSYTPSGLQTIESQTIRTYMGTGQMGCEPTATANLPYRADPWGWHTYTMRSTYDLDARRDTLVHPTNLCSNCRDRFSYEAETGFLSQVRDVQNAITTFAYDDAGRLTTVVHPGGSGITRSQTYDIEGRVLTRSSPWISDQMWYDAAGRVTRGDVTAAIGSQRTPQMIYSAMGALVYSSGLSDGAMFEEFDPDAIGNRRWQRDYGFNPGYLDRRRYLDIDGTGRLVQETQLPPSPAWYELNRNTQYDAAGNVTVTHGYEDITSSFTRWDETRSYYSADDKLVGFNRHMQQGWVSDDGGVFEQYRYDALGRRVFVRSRQTNDCSASGNSACGYAERTVWDGSQKLYEIRVPGGDEDGPAANIETDGATLGGPDEGQFGIVGYTHAGGIDQPLAIHHHSVPGIGNVSIVPHANWQGDYAFGTTSAGTECSGTCYQINWPGGRASADGELPAGTATWWWGSLIGHQGDGSGLQYMRNRYYDPKTGRFTQEDPIGLAGGLNLYGFAGGDPVNFSDPFGLCKRPKGSGVGICIESFIRGRRFGAGNARGPRSDGGGYKTSHRLSIDPSSGAHTGSSDIGSTFGIPGSGQVNFSVTGSSKSGWNITATAVNVETAFNKVGLGAGGIDYNVSLHVSPNGEVSLLSGGMWDGFPSLEVWVYPEKGKPYLLLETGETNLKDLDGRADKKLP